MKRLTKNTNIKKLKSALDSIVPKDYIPHNIINKNKTIEAKNMLRRGMAGKKK